MAFETICLDCPDVSSARENLERPCLYRGYSVPVLGGVELDMGKGTETIFAMTEEVRVCGRSQLAETLDYDRQIFEDIKRGLAGE